MKQRRRGRLWSAILHAAGDGGVADQAHAVADAIKARAAPEMRRVLLGLLQGSSGSAEPSSKAKRRKKPSTSKAKRRKKASSVDKRQLVRQRLEAHSNETPDVRFDELARSTAHAHEEQASNLARPLGSAADVQLAGVLPAYARRAAPIEERPQERGSLRSVLGVRHHGPSEGQGHDHCGPGHVHPITEIRIRKFWASPLHILILEGGKAVKPDQEK